MFHRHAYQLAARAYAGFLEQTLEDGLYVALRDLQAPGNFLIGESLQDETQDLELPFVEGGGRRLWRSSRILADCCELASLPGLRAIGWEPAGTVMTPDYFRRTMGAWLAGGPFPGLGLTALARGSDGAMRSNGLAFFTGVELELGAAPGEGPAETARLAVRLIHDLVQNGPYTSGDREGPGGELLHCTVSADCTLLKVRRNS